MAFFGRNQMYDYLVAGEFSGVMRAVLLANKCICVVCASVSCAGTWTHLILSVSDDVQRTETDYKKL